MIAGAKCEAVTKEGKPCRSDCKKGEKRCKTHQKMYDRENPTDRLSLLKNDTETAVLKILDKMRSPESKTLLDKAFVELLVAREIFPPAKNINKFVTGGVAEDILAELIGALGFNTENVAQTETVIDIKVDVPMDTDSSSSAAAGAGSVKTIGISLKNSGSIDQQPVLENYRGESKTEIRPLPPTFIIYTETLAKRVRIVYLDDKILHAAYPDLDLAAFNATVYNKKADGGKESNLSFRSGFLRRTIPRLPESYIVNATFPEMIPKVESRSITLLALEYVRSAINKVPEGEVAAPVAVEADVAEEDADD
jgi:hypothetical protein